MINKIFVSILVLLLSGCAVHQESKPLSVEDARTGVQRPDADTDCSYFYFLWGRTAELESRYDEAVEAYEKAIVCDETAYYVIRRLAVLLVRLNKKQQAISWIEKITSQDPSDNNARQLLANLYGSIAEFDKAAEIYLDLLKAEPENTEVMYLLGSLYLSNFEYAKARTYLERLVEVDPQSTVGHHALAKLYRELQYIDKATKEYNKVLEINWSLAIAAEAAEFFEAQERYDDAIRLYKSITDHDVMNEGAWGRLIRLYLQMGNSEAAIDALEEMGKYSFDSEKLDFTLGRIYLEQEEFDKARELFISMLDKDPDLHVARSLLALTYYEMGKYDEAKRLLKLIPPDSQGYEEALFMLIRILREEKKYEEAIATMQDAIRKSESASINYYSILATLYRESGDIDAGIGVFEEALAEFPEMTEAHFEYGMYLEKAGLFDEAFEQMMQVLELNPDDPYALNYVGYTWADNNENLEKSLEYVQRAIDQRPEDGFIRDSLGWVYFKLGEFDLAIVELEKAIRMAGDDPTIHEHLGDVFREKNDLQKALDAYKKALSLLTEDNDDTRRRLEKKIEEIESAQ